MEAPWKGDYWVAIGDSAKGKRGWYGKSGRRHCWLEEEDRSQNIVFKKWQGCLTSSYKRGKTPVRWYGREEGKGGHHASGEHLKTALDRTMCHA